MSAPLPLTCSWTGPTPQRARLALDGELDHASSEHLLDEVLGYLDGHPELRELTVDCRRLGFCDSSGLAALLMVRRRTEAAGVRLLLTDRGPELERLLRVTNTLRHLTGATASQEKHLDS